MAKGIDYLNSSVSELRNVGPKTGRLLEKMQIRTIGDILYHIPVKYLDFSAIKKINEIKLDEDVTIHGEIVLSELKRYPNITIFTCAVKDETSVIPAIWFNQPYLQKILQTGRKVFLSGKITKKLRRLQMENPVYELSGEDNDELTHTGRLIPVHPSTAGLSRRQLRSIIKEALKSLDNIVDPLAQILLLANEQRLPATGYRLTNLADAFKSVHFPSKDDDCKKAIWRFGWEECFYFFLMQYIRKYMWKKQQGIAHERTALFEKAMQRLPFSLTLQQEECLEQILSDMKPQNAMNRLIQGDVGSGKTVVAFLSMLNAAGCGFQSVMMAPTEILAEQHYEKFDSLFESLKVKSVLLTSSISGQQRKESLNAIQNGGASIIIGTHALIQEKIIFKNLSLVVIDEQHKFGVAQRSKLKSKALSTPDVLMLTATPIPRTLSSVIYGDLDVNTIDEFPSKQRIVETNVVSRMHELQVIKKVKELISRGSQAFVVCPSIEESSATNLQNVEAEFERWADMLYPYRIGKIHGKMTSEHKNSVMKDFRAGFLDVLICTSVIEVGIDIPNATVMVINNAERFGLSQLHQMRGRIGRRGDKSYCFLIADSPSGISYERLKAMEKHDNGFKLSEIDLKLRGEGEIHGLRQWGKNNFKFVDIADDMQLFQLAKKEVSCFFDNKNSEKIEDDILTELKRRYSLQRELIEEFENNCRKI